MAIVASISVWHTSKSAELCREKQLLLSHTESVLNSYDSSWEILWEWAFKIKNMKLFLHWKYIRLRTTALAVWWAEYWNAGLRTHFYVRKCVCTFYGLCAIFALNFGSWKIVCSNLWHSCFILLKLQTSKQRTDLIFMDSSSVREKKRKRRQKKKMKRL